MKKVLLTTGIILAIILASCSKDDEDNSGKIPVTHENIAGLWYVKSFIKENGTVVIHKNYCNAKRDSILFYNSNRMNFFTHYGCQVKLEVGCAQFILDKSNNRISYCNEMFNGFISKLTDKEMQIDYDAPLDLEYIGDPKDCKSMILSRE